MLVKEYDEMINKYSTMLKILKEKMRNLPNAMGSSVGKIRSGARQRMMDA